MKRFTICVTAVVLCGALSHAGETVRLKATADIGLSSVKWKKKDEKLLSWGLSKRFKLKSIQEMGAVRFDATPAKGREVLEATLFLHRAGPDMLRYIRVSTVNGDWEEGKTAKDYGPPSGACFNYADYDSKRPWSWPGSQFCDVVMGSGNSLWHWSECSKRPGGWISVELPAKLIYALAVGDSDGLAVMEGGTLALRNNFVHSVQSGRTAPYIEAELGAKLTGQPAKPAIEAAPAPAKAHVRTGAARVGIAPQENVFCWRVKVGGEPLGSWRVPHPEAGKATEIVLDDLEPLKAYAVEVVAVSPGGAVSAAARASVRASAALGLPVALERPAEPTGRTEAIDGGQFRVWACPPLIKIDPVSSKALCGDMAGGGDAAGPSAIWKTGKVDLLGCRGEYVSFQLVIEATGEGGELAGVKITPGALAGPGGAAIRAGEVELYRNWYTRNKNGKWQPAYLVPLKAGAELGAPGPVRKLEGQRNRTVYVDVYIPKDAPAGRYSGTIEISTGGVARSVPVRLVVADFDMPDELAFWPQLNTYRLPKSWKAYYRLAHANRCVFFYRMLSPEVSGEGKAVKVNWKKYDSMMAPLLSGSLFEDLRRSGVPIEAYGLPFRDYWPTELTKKTYDYKGYWPKKGDDRKTLFDHFMKAAYIEDALSDGYKQAFHAVQRQFVEHFKANGWDRTEMQCMFMGKMTHRIQYGINMWWTTDEPYHWDDWLALEFFNRHFKAGPGADAKRWVTRADISRPQWQGDFMDGVLDTIYFGTGSVASAAQIRRCRRLCERGGVDMRFYGSASPDTASNTSTLSTVLNYWLLGGTAALPWQTVGPDKALDVNDAAAGGNCLLVDGSRLGHDCLADMRIKAYRDAEQFVEYLKLFENRYGLRREQVRAIVQRAVRIEAKTAEGAGADNAEALRVSGLKAWQIEGLRRSLARLIAAKPR